MPALARAGNTFRRIALAILASEDLLICCNSDSQAREVTAMLQAQCQLEQLPGRVNTATVPSNDTWARDFGPLSLATHAGFHLLDATFNAWGNKYDSALDNHINHRLDTGGYLGALAMHSTELVLEGGALETDGAGTLLTTRHCLLNPNRNGPITADWMEHQLAELLGISRIHWLDHGLLEGDDTDGHIDTLARFCAPEHIVYQGCDNPQDSHYPALQAMAEQLACLTTRVGEPYELTELPWPEAIHDADGQRLPATYANFLILNDAVLVPVYDLPQDERACAVLAECFPSRRIVPVACRTLLEQGGSLHCLTMQLPPGATPQ